MCVERETVFNSEFSSCGVISERGCTSSAQKGEAHRNEDQLWNDPVCTSLVSGKTVGQVCLDGILN